LALQRDDTVDFDVEADPKDLFGHSNESLDSVEDTGDPEGTPLTELKSMVLSLDWEITDEIMSRFVQEIEKLKHTYWDDRILLSFLGLLDSVGKYIKTHKTKAHPSASKLLNSSYMSLEKVIVSKDITEPERKRILAGQVKSFKRLKEQIALRKAASDRKKALKPPDQIGPVAEEQISDLSMQSQGRTPDGTKERLRESDVGCVSPHEVFMSALEEIKQLIQEEFKALRKDLKQSRGDEQGRA
jgi:hypothetical protein